VLSDELWDRIERLLPAVKGPMGRPFRDHRQVIEGIVYRYRAGIAWRVLPGGFGLW
jgi:transposase